MTRAPSGWPPGLPPPNTPEFTARVGGWLFDLCPPRYRDHPVLRRHPAVLAWLAVRHVGAQADALQVAVAAARAELVATVDAVVMAQLLAALEAESAALLADARGVTLVAEALAGRRFVPRL